MNQAITTEVTPRQLIERSVTGNTRKAYRWAIHALDSWLDEHGYRLDDASLSRYLAHLYNQRKSPATASQIIAAVRFSGRMAGESVVGSLTERALSAYRKELNHIGRGQAHGIQWEDADKIVLKAFQEGDLYGYRDAAIVSIMSDGLLRIGEVTSLQYADVDMNLRARSGLVHVRRSKTDQEGKGATLFLGHKTIKYIHIWTAEAKVTSGYLFRRIYKGKREIVHPSGLTTRSIMRIIKKRAREAGITENVSGHSLRVGSAQSLAHAGASLVDMQISGRWKSPEMPARYASGEMASRGAVARLRYGEHT